MSLFQSEIDTYEAKLVLLRNQKEDIMVSITIQQEHIQNVEEELSEERSHLEIERAALQGRQEQLSDQQVITTVH